MVWDLRLAFRVRFWRLGLGFKVRVRACPITIVNLIFANVKMGAKWQGGEVSSIQQEVLPYHEHNLPAKSKFLLIFEINYWEFSLLIIAGLVRPIHSQNVNICSPFLLRSNAHGKEQLEPTHLDSLFNKIVRSGFTISSPLFQNNWVKIRHRKNKVR